MSLEKRSSGFCGQARRWGVALLVAGVTACANDGETPRLPDGGSDAGLHPDASEAADAGDPDLGVELDAQTPDSGRLDLCDPLQQSGCEAPSSKCIIERGPAECVVPSGAEVGFGETCVGGQCQPGMVCIGDGTGAAPSCRKICDGDSGAGCAGLPVEADCLERVRNTNWGVCSPLPPACDVLTQAPCPDGESCQPFMRFGGSFDLRCRAAGPAQEDEACSAERCARGLVCINLGGALQCKKICDDDTWCEPEGQCNGRVNGVAVKYCTR